MIDDRPQTIAWLSAARNLLWWIFSVLVAIAILQFNALAGLGAALVGGVIFGFLLFK